MNPENYCIQGFVQEVPPTPPMPMELLVAMGTKVFSGYRRWRRTFVFHYLNYLQINGNL
jgi:hypothetical protein